MSFARLEKRYRTRGSWSKIWYNYEPRPEEQKTLSLLAFLRPLLREATERSSNFNTTMKKRYWANVSQASTQSEDTERRVLTRTKRRRKRRRTLEAAHRQPLRFLEREQRLCRRLSLCLYIEVWKKRCFSNWNNSFYVKWSYRDLRGFTWREGKPRPTLRSSFSH